MPSVDGKKYKGTMNIKFGDPFLKKGTHELENPYQGRITAWVYEVGTPYWNPDCTVTIPFRYMITQIHEPSKRYKNKKKKEEIGLKLIK